MHSLSHPLTQPARFLSHTDVTQEVIEVDGAKLLKVRSESDPECPHPNTAHAPPHCTMHLGNALYTATALTCIL